MELNKTREHVDQLEETRSSEIIPANLRAEGELPQLGRPCGERPGQLAERRAVVRDCVSFEAQAFERRRGARVQRERERAEPWRFDLVPPELEGAQPPERSALEGRAEGADARIANAIMREVERLQTGELFENMPREQTETTARDAIEGHVAGARRAQVLHPRPLIEGSVA